ncbi:GNAT family N-acetyltransferase [Bifidobacterium tsurumiense]|uniref:GNAT family acetyltransferase n=1 Tax=Bifidobacterium tsurumiense TaxID=356829 RepID=A0A087EKI0_9BIFI|nr:GNAT family N-acetyltransferase [Bifidobacterium tsurumiense]KFJ08281.1 GNAT family acetyltransferase [Bifidobacterium tsurumiense]MDY4677976.1 GNAT family N-acetyltransferase [Bifidobacterium tsurumiense]MSS12265.1 GNAT family N-acetyltransferase [Bifidobacterium tsurumiense]
MTRFREAATKDVPRIAKLTTRSFGNYPLFDFAFLKAFRNDDAYFAYIEKLHRIHTKANMRHHKCFVGMENNHIASVALLQDPAQPRASIWDYITAGAVSLVYPVGFIRILDFFDISEESVKDCEQQYPNAWHLEILAVDGSMKGRGLGKSMLNDCVIPFIKARGGTELTLTTNTEQNRTFYAKQGFEEFAERTIQRHGKTINNWSFRLEV